MSVTPNGERDEWGMAATMDHSDIRDWVPHYISSSRGCLALETEIIPKDARLK
jgi:hypothetical protein